VPSLPVLSPAANAVAARQDSTQPSQDSTVDAAGSLDRYIGRFSSTETLSTTSAASNQLQHSNNKATDQNEKDQQPNEKADDGDEAVLFGGEPVRDADLSDFGAYFSCSTPLGLDLK
jgi:hypothetical protein